MALIIDLKPSEKIVIGNSLITNDTYRARLHIEGDAPILRERDIMTEADANTPCKRIYLAIQLMYLSHDPKTLHKTCILSDVLELKNLRQLLYYFSLTFLILFFY